MRLFRRQKDSPKIEGEIGYHGLADWWLSSFTEDERDYIESKLGGGSGRERPLTQGQITSTTGTASQLLSGLSTWFDGQNDRHIARRILAKAEEVGKGDILDQHFTYAQMIKVYYKDREKNPEALESAIQACEKQIELAPRAAEAFRRDYPNSPLPAHTGFEKLAIVREKQKEFDEAIRVAATAKNMGWAGDWDKRIERCKTKGARQ